MKESTKEEIANWVMGLGFIFLMVVIFIILNNSGFFFDEEEKAFCVERGFNKTTDVYKIDCRGGGKSIHLECDKKTILIAENARYCQERNKWGGCSWYGSKMIDSNSTCINQYD